MCCLCVLPLQPRLVSGQVHFGVCLHGHAHTHAALFLHPKTARLAACGLHGGVHTHSHHLTYSSFPASLLRSPPIPSCCKTGRWPYISWDTCTTSSCECAEVWFEAACGQATQRCYAPAIMPCIACSTAHTHACTSLFLAVCVMCVLCDAAPAGLTHACCGSASLPASRRCVRLYMGLPRHMP